MSRRTVLVAAGLVVLVLGCVALAAWYRHWQAWVAYETGAQNTQGTPPNYNYWSGFGSVFPWSAGIIGGLVTIVYQHAKKANCHVHGCLRLGGYPAGEYRVCRKHHREITGEIPTIAHLREHHRLHRESLHLYLGQRPGKG